MKPVAKMTGEEFAKGEKRLSEQVNEYFDDIGNVAHNDVIGDVELDYRAVDDDISHGIGRVKSISFKAVPDVIEKGEIIDVRKNWKNREYDTVAIGAPVVIGKTDYYMGVIVRRVLSITVRKGDVDIQRHYVHEVIIEKISTNFKAGQTNVPGTGVNADLSIFNLLQTVVEVKKGKIKREDLMNIISSDEGQFSLKEDSDGKTLSEGQREYFKDSKLVDADGKLYFYDIQGIKKDTAKIGLPLSESQPIHNDSEVIINGSFKNSIPENSGNDKKLTWTYKELSLVMGIRRKRLW